MKALVTGATGFIGRRLVAGLIRNGVEVVALSRDPNPALPKHVQIIHGDILDPASLKDAGKGCNRLYHLAALITFDPARREELLAVNGQGTANILSAAARWQIERTLVVSSACTIGLSQDRHALLDETTPPPLTWAHANPYLASKLAAEQAAFTAARSNHVVIANPSTVYGPGDAAMNSGTLIKQIATSQLVPVPGGGSNVVDIDDVVEGIIAAGEHGKSGQRYILGGENLLFSEIFSTISSVTGHRPLFIPLPAFARGPLKLAAGIAGRLTGNRFITPQIIGDLFAFKFYSNKLAADNLGWKPSSNFRQSVERAWAFYLQHNLIPQG